uniref:Uncharacterized protein n=1 Tax=Timema douglasi TaxID=61478 RepID=A0A7R8VRX4_TIMDO|nr:unnamed protein product [Timema douglasi]
MRPGRLNSPQLAAYSWLWRSPPGLLLQQTLLERMNITARLETRWRFQHISTRVGYLNRGRYQQLVPLSTPFPCNTEGGRSPTPPTSVHKLRPGDIDVIGAMGDSITGGNGIAARNLLQVLVDNRGMSWSIGGQNTWREFLTLPNILKEFNPDLIGYSLGDSLSHQKGSQFNVADGGAMSRDMPFQAKLLVRRMKRDKRVDIKNHWKSSYRGGKSLQSSYRGGKSIQSSYRGGKSLQSSYRGGKSIQSSYLGGKSIQSSYRGGKSIQSSYLGGKSIQSSYLGGKSLQSSYRGGKSLQSSYLGGKSLQSSYLGGKSIQSSYLGGKSIQSSYRGGHKTSTSINLEFDIFDELNILSPREVKKVVTIHIGGNDFCLDMCYQDEDQVPENHRNNLQRSLDYLQDNLPRTLVNLVTTTNRTHLSGQMIRQDSQTNGPRDIADRPSLGIAPSDPNVEGVKPRKGAQHV